MAIATPCINICVLEPATGLCRGCARTGTEIAVWASLTDSQRRAIMQQLPGRRSRIGGKQTAASPAADTAD